jgi:glycosyltransferase involved in cell wall biosynthesis
MNSLTTGFGNKAKKIVKEKNFDATNNPHSFMRKLINKNKKKVTVVTAAYNAEKFIGRTIESVINQSLGSDNIEFIIVDDCSTDSTREIVKYYMKENQNISLISLKENTGSPGTPRNVGIELATTDYITFLDADDWLHKDGLEALYTILKETNDDYAVGKTIKVEKAGETVIGEFASVKERRKITPFEVPHFFYHMGPTARMMKRDILINKDIRFPEMRFGEDKVFFSDLFFHVKSVSTTTKPIYYANRLEENNTSLTRTTDVLDKRKNDLEIIKYIKSQNLPLHMEKTALTRIYEYDFLRTFDSYVFVNSQNKGEFISLFQEVIETTKDLRYNFLDEFKTPFYKKATRLFVEGRKNEFIDLFNWLKKEKDKQHVIRDGLPYYEIPFLQGEERYIRIPFIAWSLDSEVIENKVFKQTFEIYGDSPEEINGIIIRDRKEVGNDLTCEFEIKGNKGYLTASIEDLDKLKTSLYTVFIRYNDYQLINIKVKPKNQIIHNKREYTFYTTKANNLGFSIKSTK